MRSTGRDHPEKRPWTRGRRLLAPLALAILVGCGRRPPEAPTELEDLCAFLFEHAPDEDSEVVTAAMENLSIWLDAHLEETSEGYEVRNLDQGALDVLDNRERPNEDLVGAAVSTTSTLRPTDLTDALVTADQTEVYPGTYAEFERSFVTDEGCFVARSCDRLELTNHAVTSLPFGIRLTSDSTGQFRWVEVADGTALLTRSWLHEAAQSNLNLIAIDAQYHLSATLPRDGGLVRLQATWVDAELIGLNVPEGTALNMLISSFQDNDEALYVYAADR